MTRSTTGRVIDVDPGMDDLKKSVCDVNKSDVNATERVPDVNGSIVAVNPR
jgi:hypothetical protein